MNQETIIASIEAKVGETDYKIWRIGITDDPERTKQYWSETEKKKTFFWTEWEADSLLDAQQIKSHFVTDHGMKNGMENHHGEVGGVYVYIF